MNEVARSRILVSADTALALVVDVQSHLHAILAAADDTGAWNSLAAILKHASTLSVPIVFTTIDGAGANAPTHVKNIPHVIHLSRSELNPWENGPIRQALSDLGRETVIVAGDCAEGGVTFAALGALELGYQPYVVVDAIRAGSDLELKTALARMIQAGAVAVTSRQLLLEWSR